MQFGRFDGTASRDQVYETAKAMFEDDVLSFCGMKLGPLGGPETLSFLDRNGEECGMRKYMSEYRLKPCVSVMYLLTDEPPTKKKKKNRTPCTPSESTDEPKQPGDGEEDQESPTEQDKSSDEELQPTQEQLESVTKIDAAHIKKTGKELERGSQAVVFEGLWGNVKVALKECVVPTESDASYIQDCGFTLPIATSKHPHLVRHKHSQHYRNPCHRAVRQIPGSHYGLSRTVNRC